MLASFGPNDYFASPIELPADPPIQDRVLALTGRQP
jgi:hypothetical protein